MTRRTGCDESGPAAPEPLREQRDFARSFDSLEAVFAFVHSVLDAHGVNKADAYAIDLVIEELFTNMVKYNAAGCGRLAVGIECDGEAVSCGLSDPDSDRFDPTAAPDADINAPVEQRRPGGLGIHLSRRLVDSIEYTYAGRCSTITFRRRLNSDLGRDAAGTSDKH